MADWSILPPPSGNPPPPPESPPPTHNSVSQATLPLQTQFQPPVPSTKFHSVETPPVCNPLQCPLSGPERTSQHHLSPIGYAAQSLLYPPNLRPYSDTLPIGSAPPPWTLPPEVWMYDNTGAHLQTVTQTSLEPSEEIMTSADGYQSLCSYNWVVAHQQNPTIYVPGYPRIYRPLE